MVQPKDILSACKDGFTLVDGEIRNGEAVVGAWIPEERRVAWNWSAMGVDAPLIERAREEAASFDDWSRERVGDIARIPPHGDGGVRYGRDAWLRSRPPLRAAEAASGIPIDFAGKRVLDIGGSAQNLLFWLPERPARVDHVDVSPVTQNLGLARLRKAHDDYETRYGTPVVFHTIPAEYMPFEDGAFDLVFSWSSLHHCRRPRVFEQAVRVLAPGGVLVLLDRYLSGPLYVAMRARRRLLAMERGTDDPIRRREFRRLAAMMDEAWWAPFGSARLLGYIRETLLRSRKGPLSGYRGLPPPPSQRGVGRFLDRWLGRDVVFLGRKRAEG